MTKINQINYPQFYVTNFQTNAARSFSNTSVHSSFQTLGEKSCFQRFKEWVQAAIKKIFQCCYRKEAPLPRQQPVVELPAPPLPIPIDPPAALNLPVAEVLPPAAMLAAPDAPALAVAEALPPAAMLAAPDAPAPEIPLREQLLETIRTQANEVVRLKDKIHQIDYDMEYLSGAAREDENEFNSDEPDSEESLHAKNNILGMRSLAILHMEESKLSLAQLEHAQNLANAALQNAREQFPEDAEYLRLMRREARPANNVGSGYYYYAESLYTMMKIYKLTAKISYRGILPREPAARDIYRHIRTKFAEAHRRITEASDLVRRDQAGEINIDEEHLQTLQEISRDLQSKMDSIENREVALSAQWITSDMRERPAMHEMALAPQNVIPIPPFIQIPACAPDGAPEALERAMNSAIGLQESRRDLETYYQVLSNLLMVAKNLNIRFSQARNQQDREYVKIILQERKRNIRMTLQFIRNIIPAMRQAYSNVSREMNEVAPDDRNALWQEIQMRNYQNVHDVNLITIFSVKHVLDTYQISAQMTVRMIEADFHADEEGQGELHARQALEEIEELVRTFEGIQELAINAHRENVWDWLRDTCTNVLPQLINQADLSDRKLEEAWIQVTRRR